MVWEQVLKDLKCNHSYEKLQMIAIYLLQYLVHKQALSSRCPLCICWINEWIIKLFLQDQILMREERKGQGKLESYNAKEMG